MRRVLWLCMVPALGALGCGEARPARLSERWMEAAAQPARYQNGWDNGFAQDIIALALASGPIGASPSVANTLRNNPDSRSFFHYIVGCALPRGAQVVVPPGGADLTFDGLAGLAPEWATGPCQEACQEWVSACLLSRTNAYGIPVLVSPRGEHPALAAFGSEVTAMPVEEAAFYGNFFLGQPRAYACRGRGYDPLYLTFRACSLPGDLCGIEDVGPCGEIDGDTGSPSSRHACEGYSTDAGARTSAVTTAPPRPAATCFRIRATSTPA